MRTLKHRVRELVHITSPSVLTTQADQLLHSNMVVYHGPNSITHFDEFSLDTISAEIKQNAPALFQMFRALCHNVIVNEDCTHDDTKVITSLSVALKSRSIKVLGLQLLVGMMLVGRATNGRVRGEQ